MAVISKTPLTNTVNRENRDSVVMISGSSPSKTVLSKKKRTITRAIRAKLIQ